jgi:RHS repeat-associated protein
LTDPTGSVVEHEEYTPWGEMWFNNQNSNGTAIPNYFFTGKELDLTGLYYFGARYYDPLTSLWCSPDPILGKYLDGVGKGRANSMNFALFTYGDSVEKGVFDSKNLALYTYCHQNPMIMTDPDGRATKISIFPAGFDSSEVKDKSGNTVSKQHFEHGHMGIAAGGDVNKDSQTRGYYKKSGDLMQGPGEVKKDDMNYEAGSIILNTTPEQEKAINDYFDNLAKNPGEFKSLKNNCTTQVLKALEAAGIKAPGGNLLYDSPKDVFKELLQFEKDFNNPIKPYPVPESPKEGN